MSLHSVPLSWCIHLLFLNYLLIYFIMCENDWHIPAPQPVVCLHRPQGGSQHADPHAGTRFTWFVLWQTLNKTFPKKPCMIKILAWSWFGWYPSVTVTPQRLCSVSPLGQGVSLCSPALHQLDIDTYPYLNTVLHITSLYTSAFCISKYMSCCMSCPRIANPEPACHSPCVLIYLPAWLPVIHPHPASGLFQPPLSVSLRHRLTVFINPQHGIPSK